MSNAPSDLSDRLSGRPTFEQRNEADNTPPFQDLVVSSDLMLAPISPFYQDMRTKDADQSERRFLIEDNHIIDTRQRREESGAISCGINGTTAAFQFSDGTI